MMSRVISGLTIVLVFPACIAAQEAWSGTITDSAGVAVVANTDRGMWTESTAWSVERDLVIGSVEGDPDYQFGQIGWITATSDGRIFVLDMQAQEIKVYGPDGSYDRTIGRMGAGPGELLGAMFLVAGPGDTLLVPDVQNQRMSRFAPDGSSVGSIRLSLEDGIPVVIRSTSKGAAVQQIRPLALAGGAAPDSMDALLLLGADGSPVDTLLRFPSGRTIQLGAVPELNIFAPETSWNITDDLDVLYGTNHDYRITVVRRNGEVERIVMMPFRQSRVTDDDKNAVMRFLERAWTDAGVPPSALPQLRGAVSFGEHLPVFADLQVGPQGTIWVQHPQSASDLSDEELELYNPMEDTGAPEWDVFDAEGRFLGVVTMPSRFAPRLFREDKIYGVWRDELDVQHVMRLRIARGGDSGGG